MKEGKETETEITEKEEDKKEEVKPVEKPVEKPVTKLLTNFNPAWPVPQQTPQGKYPADEYKHNRVELDEPAPTLR